MPDADRSIVQAVQDGDTEAYRLLVERHRSKLFGVLCRITGDPGLAEELAHETFIKAYTGLERFRGDARFSTWLIQIGIHTLRDHLRGLKRSRRHQIVSFEDLQSDRGGSFDIPDSRTASDPTAGLGFEEAQDIVKAALATLPLEYRELLVLKHIEGWSYDQIAEVKGVSVGTLKVRAHRSRKLLKKEMETLGWEFDADRTAPPGLDTITGEEVGNAGFD